MDTSWVWNALITVLALPSILTPLFNIGKKIKKNSEKENNWGKKKNHTTNPLELLCIDRTVKLQSLEKGWGGWGEAIQGLFDGFL